MRTSRFLPYVLLAGLGACAERKASPPDLVLVTIDTLRADRLGTYGYFRDTSPVLDHLAEQSLVFERCIAPMATTFPSHLSLLTSTYPNETGALANVGAGGKAFSPTPQLSSLARVLQVSGYQTAAFVSAAPIKKFSGISFGFDVFDEPEEKMRDAPSTNRRVIDWIDRRGNGPSFLWVHYFDPHAPYTPPDRLAAMYRPNPEQERWLEERDFQRVYRKDSLPIHVNNKYDAEIRTVDEQIGALIDRLESEGSRWARTVLVIVGDHGEGLGQHGEKEHGGLWQEQLRVPLMMRAPGVAPRRVDRLLSVADIIPTLAGLIELPGEDVFLRQASGVDRLSERSEETVIFSQESAAPWRTHRGERKPGYALTGETWKLIHDPDGDDLLFRITDDPFELRDLSATYPDVVETLLGVLELRLDQQRQRREALGVGTSSGDEEAVDPKILDQLRSLGYIP